MGRVAETANGTERGGRGCPPPGVLCALVGAVLLIAHPRHVDAQGTGARESVPSLERVRSALAEVPFGPGEQSEYEVKLGPFSVGGAVMQVVNVEPVRSRPSYHISWRIEGGIPLARVDDHFQSWIDVETLATLRSLKKVREVGYSADRHYEIYPEAGYWDRLDTGESEEMITEFPLDDISFIYHVRSLSLEVGESYSLDRYFIADRNPVILRVLRKETIEVPRGHLRDNRRPADHQGTRALRRGGRGRNLPHRRRPTHPREAHVPRSGPGLLLAPPCELPGGRADPALKRAILTPLRVRRPPPPGRPCRAPSPRGPEHRRPRPAHRSEEPT